MLQPSLAVQTQTRTSTSTVVSAAVMLAVSSVAVGFTYAVFAGAQAQPLLPRLFRMAALDGGGAAKLWPVVQRAASNYDVAIHDPVVADVDGDGQQEVVTTYATGSALSYLAAYTPDGRPKENFGRADDDHRIRLPGKVFAPPSLADLDGDGDLELVVAARVLTLAEGELEWAVFVLHHDGSSFRVGAIERWPVVLASTSVVGSPSIGDVDGDGDLEIIVGAVRFAWVGNVWQPGEVYGWHHDGRPIWEQPLRGELHRGSTQPALGNLDDDPALEIVVASDEDQARLFAWDGSGVQLAGWPVVVGGFAQGRPPQLADLDGDGDLEAVQLTSAPQLAIVSREGPASWSSRPIMWRVRGVAGPTPALVDLDGDGDVELVAQSGEGMLYAFHHDGAAVSGQWPVTVGLVNWGTTTVTAGNVDHDAEPEILVLTKKAGATPSMITILNPDGSLVAGLGIANPYVIADGDGVLGSATVSDVDGDGLAEVVFSYGHYVGAVATAGAYVELGVNVLDLPGSYSAGAAEWPMYQHDLQRTGRYERPARFRRGDANADGAVDISDPTFLLQHLFKGGPNPPCDDAADANDDGSLDVSDSVRTLLYLFSETVTELAAPGATTPGLDPTADALGCLRYSAS